MPFCREANGPVTPSRSVRRQVIACGCRIRPLDAADVEALHGFVAEQMRCNGMGQAPPAGYFRWKFFTRAPQICLGAFDAQGRMVGALGRMSRPFSVDGERCDTTEATDAFVCRSYQGKGLFQRLVAEARRWVAANEVAFSLARPNKNSRLAAIRSGHRPLAELQLFIRPLSTQYVIDRVAGRVVGVAPLGDLWNTVRDACVVKLGQCFESVGCSELEDFDERMDVLHESSGVGAGVVRDRNYMSWRYVQGPSRYQRFALVQGERLLGVAVARLVEGDDGVRAAELADFVTCGEDRGHLSYLLLSYTLLKLAQQGAQVARCFLASGAAARDEPLRAALRLHWFVRRPAADTALLIRSETNERLTNALLCQRSWCFRAGDLDSV